MNKERKKAALLSGLLLIGFTTAVVLRLLIGGPGVSQSPEAGLIFAACLILLSVVTGVSSRTNWKTYTIGLGGGMILCLPAIITHWTHHAPAVPANGYWTWAVMVSIVALSEEVFLRGALFALIAKAGGPAAAVLIGAIAFAGLHLPLYGWHAMPLDLTIGLFLGALRLTAGSWVAPGIAHVVADLAGWWLR